MTDSYNLTPSQRAAIKALADNGGEGQMRHDGELLGIPYPEWMALLKARLVEPVSSFRIRLTREGQGASQ